jgi:hypothetical protein
MFSKIIVKTFVVVGLGFSLLGTTFIVPSVNALSVNNCTVSVKEYIAKKGKKIKFHNKACKDGNKMNNWSCKMKKKGGYYKKCY